MVVACFEQWLRTFKDFCLAFLEKRAAFFFADFSFTDERKIGINDEIKREIHFMKQIKTMILILSLIICTSCSCTPALAYTLQGKVIYVYDGDTLLLKENMQGTTPQALRASPPNRGAFTRIRLASIDAPEKDQPYGAESTLLLRKLIQNKTVLAHVQDTDKYGRKIAYIQLSNKDTATVSDPLAVSKDISSIMLANGAAWHYKAFDKTKAKYNLHYAIEQQARFNKRGLWAQEKPIAPWLWRSNPYKLFTPSTSKSRI